MIKFKWADLNDPVTTQALRKIYHCNKLEVKAAYWFSRINEKVNSERKRASELCIECHKEFGVWDEEKGQVKMTPDGKVTFDPPEREKEHDEKFVALMNTEVVADNLYPLPLESLNGVGLSPIELAHLQPFIAGLPDVDEKCSGLESA